MKHYLLAGMLALSLSTTAQAQVPDKQPPDQSQGQEQHGGHGNMPPPPHFPPPGMDADNDGSISKTEWQSFHDKRFGEMDTSKDGKVSQDEGRAFAKTRMEEMRRRMNDKGQGGGNPPPSGEGRPPEGKPADVKPKT